jgi:hypothetical protein
MGAPVLSSMHGYADRASALLDRIDCRLADTYEEKEQIFRLRYEAYLREGAITPNGEQMLWDRFDEADNCWTFGLHIDNKIASSVRICISFPDEPLTPAVEAFPDFLEPEIANGKSVMDTNRFVADAELARIYPELPYLTVRLAYMASAYFDTDYAIATARREHQAFYKRVFGMKVVCEPRAYPTLTKPLSLMLVDCHSYRAKVVARYPYFRSTFFERRMLFEQSSSPRAAAMLKRKLPSANANEAAGANENAAGKEAAAVRR